MIEIEAIREKHLIHRKLLDELDPWIERREAVVALNTKQSDRVCLL